MLNMSKVSAIALLVAAVTGCAVGPDYQAPQSVANIDVSAAYQQTELAQNWWQAFDDATLNQLITEALSQNRTLAQARYNAERAYVVFNDTSNDWQPKGTLDAGYQASENSSVSALDDGEVSHGYNIGVNLNWDLDLFGKIRRATEAAKANAQQAELLWQDARLQLISQVASTYGDYRGAQMRLVVAEQNLHNLQQSRDIVKARFDAGMASELELAQIDVQLHQVQAGVPVFRTALLTAGATLSGLLAKQPGELKLGAATHLPELKQPVALVEGENYLRYRADVAVAERALAVSMAQIGVATADLYPNLSVRGFLGFISGPGLTLNGDTQSWMVAPTLSWQAADLGSVKARIRQAEADNQIALAQFEQQVFSALNEMKLALFSYNLSREQQISTEAQLQAANKALKIARDRYNVGSGDFLSLLDAERELLRTRDQLAIVQQQNFNRLVGVYSSFGGGLQLI